MARTKLVATLSKNSFGTLAKQVQQYGKLYKQGVALGVEEATKECYELICKLMSANNLSTHTGNVKWKFDSKTNIGTISTNDIVIIFHEFGTGIKGSQSEWANVFGYKVNQSGKGQTGWKFYNKEHGYGGITHGLETKKIFYQAFVEIRKKLPQTVSVSVSKTVGAMY